MILLATMAAGCDPAGTVDMILHVQNVEDGTPVAGACVSLARQHNMPPAYCEMGRTDENGNVAACWTDIMDPWADSYQATWLIRVDTDDSSETLALENEVGPVASGARFSVAVVSSKKTWVRGGAQYCDPPGCVE